MYSRVSPLYLDAQCPSVSSRTCWMLIGGYLPLFFFLQALVRSSAQQRSNMLLEYKTQRRENTFYMKSHPFIIHVFIMISISPSISIIRHLMCGQTDNRTECKPAVKHGRKLNSQMLALICV